MTTDNTKIIDKIKKLLALSESSNPNEAFLAAKRARNLMDKHSITKAEIESAGSSQFLESVSEHIYRQRNAWVINLQNAVGKLNDCISALHFEYKSEKQTVKHLYRGFKSDAIVATMTLDYLIDACERCCKTSGVKGRSEKNQFRLGFASMIEMKSEWILEERMKSFVADTGTNIIPLKMNQINSFFGELSTDAGLKYRKPTLKEMDAYIRGVKAGQMTGLDKQLDEDEIKKLGYSKSVY